MPIYNFECQIGHKFEKLVKMGTKTVVCEKCELDGLHTNAHKVISVPAPAHFSGHGWTPKRLERK